jgi:hypothetical protein
LVSTQRIGLWNKKKISVAQHQRILPVFGDVVARGTRFLVSTQRIGLWNKKKISVAQRARAKKKQSIFS